MPRSTSPMAAHDLRALLNRLDEAAAALLAAGCLSQAVARKYYVVYHIAYQIALVTGLEVEHSFSRGVADQDFRHEEMADIVESLYTGNRSPGSRVKTVGSTPGIGATALSGKAVWVKTDTLRIRRVAADYQGGGGKEPLTRAQAESLIADADLIASELRRLLPP